MSSTNDVERLIHSLNNSGNVQNTVNIYGEIQDCVSKSSGSLSEPVKDDLVAAIKLHLTNESADLQKSALTTWVLLLRTLKCITDDFVTVVYNSIKEVSVDECLLSLFSFLIREDCLELDKLLTHADANICKQVLQSVFLASKDVPTETYYNFILDKVVNNVFMTSDDDVRRLLLEFALTTKDKYPLTDLSRDRQKQLGRLFNRSYLTVVDNLRIKNNLVWYQLCIFMMKYCGQLLHSEIELTNGILRNIEAGFKTRTVDDRLMAYECWKVLIDNCSLDRDYLCSNKQLKLLVKPLKIRLSKHDQVICKRFEVWSHFMEALQEKAVVYLSEYLEFCFGPFGTTSVENLTSVSDVIVKTWLKGTEILMKMIGHYGHEGSCMSSETFNFKTPIVTAANFVEFHYLIIDSIGICCERMLQWEEKSAMDVKIKCLWGSLFSFIKQVEDKKIKENILQKLSNQIKYLLNKSLTQPEYFDDILKHVFEVFTAFEEPICDIVIANQIIIFPLLEILMPETGLTADRIAAVTDLVKYGSKVDNKLFYFDLACAVLRTCVHKKKECDLSLEVWLQFAGVLFTICKTPKDSFQEFKENAQFFMCWIVKYMFPNSTNDAIVEMWKHIILEISAISSAFKENVLQEFEKIVKESPDIIVSFIDFLPILAQLIPEEKINKTFVILLLNVTLECLKNPCIPKVKAASIVSVVRRIVDVGVRYDTTDEKVTEKLFSCVVEILQQHQVFEVLPVLKNYFSKMPDKVKQKVPESLRKIINDLVTHSDLSVSKDAIFLLSELEKPCKPKKPTFVQPTLSSRSARIAGMATGGLSTSSIPSTLRLFGQDVDTMSPVRLKGSQINKVSPSSRAMKIANAMPKIPKSIKNLEEEDDKGFVLISKEVKVDKSKMSEHQKEVMRKRREDIPALYQDLSQSQHSSSESSQSKFEDAKKISEIIESELSELGAQKLLMETSELDESIGATKPCESPKPSEEPKPDEAQKPCNVENQKDLLENQEGKPKISEELPNSDDGIKTSESTVSESQSDAGDPESDFDPSKFDLESAQKLAQILLSVDRAKTLGEAQNSGMQPSASDSQPDSATNTKTKPVLESEQTKGTNLDSGESKSGSESGDSSQASNNKLYVMYCLSDFENNRELGRNVTDELKAKEKEKKSLDLQSSSNSDDAANDDYRLSDENPSDLKTASINDDSLEKLPKGSDSSSPDESQTARKRSMAKTRIRRNEVALLSVAGDDNDQEYTRVRRTTSIDAQTKNSTILKYESEDEKEEEQRLSPESASRKVKKSFKIIPRSKEEETKNPEQIKLRISISKEEDAALTSECSILQQLDDEISKIDRNLKENSDVLTYGESFIDTVDKLISNAIDSESIDSKGVTVEEVVGILPAELDQIYSSEMDEVRSSGLLDFDNLGISMEPSTGISDAIFGQSTEELLGKHSDFIGADTEETAREESLFGHSEDIFQETRRSTHQDDTFEEKDVALSKSPEIGGTYVIEKESARNDRPEGIPEGQLNLGDVFDDKMDDNTTSDEQPSDLLESLQNLKPKTGGLIAVEDEDREEENAETNKIGGLSGVKDENRIENSKAIEDKDQLGGKAEGDSKFEGSIESIGHNIESSVVPKTKPKSEAADSKAENREEELNSEVKIARDDGASKIEGFAKDRGAKSETVTISRAGISKGDFEIKILEDIASKAEVSGMDLKSNTETVRVSAERNNKTETVGVFEEEIKSKPEVTKVSREQKSKIDEIAGSERKSKSEIVASKAKNQISEDKLQSRIGDESASKTELASKSDVDPLALEAAPSQDGGDALCEIPAENETHPFKAVIRDQSESIEENFEEIDRKEKNEDKLDSLLMVAYETSLEEDTEELSKVPSSKHQEDFRVKTKKSPPMNEEKVGSSFGARRVRRRKDLELVQFVDVTDEEVVRKAEDQEQLDSFLVVARETSPEEDANSKQVSKHLQHEISKPLPLRVFGADNDASVKSTNEIVGSSTGIRRRRKKESELSRLLATADIGVKESEISQLLGIRNVRAKEIGQNAKREEKSDTLLTVAGKTSLEEDFQQLSATPSLESQAETKKLPLTAVEASVKPENEEFGSNSPGLRRRRKKKSEISQLLGLRNITPKEIDHNQEHLKVPSVGLQTNEEVGSSLDDRRKQESDLSRLMNLPDITVKPVGQKVKREEKLDPIPMVAQMTSLEEVADIQHETQSLEFQLETKKSPSMDVSTPNEEVVSSSPIRRRRKKQSELSKLLGETIERVKNDENPIIANETSREQPSLELQGSQALPTYDCTPNDEAKPANERVGSSPNTRRKRRKKERELKRIQLDIVNADLFLTPRTRKTRSLRKSRRRSTPKSAEAKEAVPVPPTDAVGADLEPSKLESDETQPSEVFDDESPTGQLRKVRRRRSQIGSALQLKGTEEIDENEAKTVQEADADAGQKDEEVDEDGGTKQAEEIDEDDWFMSQFQSRRTRTRKVRRAKRSLFSVERMEDPTRRRRRSRVVQLEEEPMEDLSRRRRRNIVDKVKEEIPTEHVESPVKKSPRGKTKNQNLEEEIRDKISKFLGSMMCGPDLHIGVRKAEHNERGLTNRKRKRSFAAEELVSKKWMDGDPDTEDLRGDYVHEMPVKKRRRGVSAEDEEKEESDMSAFIYREENSVMKELEDVEYAEFGKRKTRRRRRRKGEGKPEDVSDVRTEEEEIDRTLEDQAIKLGTDDSVAETRRSRSRRRRYPNPYLTVSKPRKRSSRISVLKTTKLEDEDVTQAQIQDSEDVIESSQQTETCESILRRSEQKSTNRSESFGRFKNETEQLNSEIEAIVSSITKNRSSLVNIDEHLSEKGITEDVLEKSTEGILEKGAEEILDKNTEGISQRSSENSLKKTAEASSAAGSEELTIENTESPRSERVRSPRSDGREIGTPRKEEKPEESPLRSADELEVIEELQRSFENLKTFAAEQRALETLDAEVEQEESSGCPSVDELCQELNTEADETLVGLNAEDEIKKDRGNESLASFILQEKNSVSVESLEIHEQETKTLTNTESCNPNENIDISHLTRETQVPKPTILIGDLDIDSLPIGFNTPRKQDLPSSPVGDDTPVRNSELLTNTLDISPIRTNKSEPKDGSVTDLNVEEPSSGEGIFAKQPSSRSAKLLNLLPNSSSSSALVTKPSKSVISHIQKSGSLRMTSPSTERIRKMIMNCGEKVKPPSFDSESELEIMESDVLAFTREVPSPLAVPNSSILKRKAAEVIEEGISPCPKRKRVNFSDPPTTCEKIFFKEEDEHKLHFKKSLKKLSFKTDSKNGAERPDVTADTSFSLISGLNLMKAEPIHPQLTSCNIDIQEITTILKKDSLLEQFQSVNVLTVGDLARLNDSQVSQLEFLESPKLLRIMDALEVFYSSYREDDEAKAVADDEADDWQMEADDDAVEVGTKAPIFPELADCNDSVQNILKLFATVNTAREFKRKNILTVGDLAALSREEIGQLNVRKVSRVEHALSKYYRKLKREHAVSKQAREGIEEELTEDLDSRDIDDILDNKREINVDDSEDQSEFLKHGVASRKAPLLSVHTFVTSSSDGGDVLPEQDEPRNPYLDTFGRSGEKFPQENLIEYIRGRYDLDEIRGICDALLNDEKK